MERYRGLGGDGDRGRVAILMVMGILGVDGQLQGHESCL